VAQPTPYSLAYSFQGWQISNPNRPLPADKIENEYNDIALTLSQTLANLALIQRDDGSLANQTVGFDQLKPELSGGIPQPTAWATSTPYKKGDTVFNGVSLYRNLVAHTSGVFASDLSNGYWLLLVSLTGGSPAQFHAQLGYMTLFFSQSRPVAEGPWMWFPTDGQGGVDLTNWTINDGGS